MLHRNVLLDIRGNKQNMYFGWLNSQSSFPRLVPALRSSARLLRNPVSARRLRLLIGFSSPSGITPPRLGQTTMLGPQSPIPCSPTCPSWLATRWLLLATPTRGLTERSVVKTDEILEQLQIYFKRFIIAVVSAGRG